MTRRKPTTTALETASAAFLKTVGNSATAIIDAIAELEAKLDALEGAEREREPAANRRRR